MASKSEKLMTQKSNWPNIKVIFHVMYGMYGKCCLFRCLVLTIHGSAAKTLYILDKGESPSPNPASLASVQEDEKSPEHREQPKVFAGHLTVEICP